MKKAKTATKPNLTYFYGTTESLLNPKDCLLSYVVRIKGIRRVRQIMASEAVENLERKKTVISNLLIANRIKAKKIEYLLDKITFYKEELKKYDSTH